MMVHPPSSPDRLRDLLFPRKADGDRRMLDAAVRGGLLTREQAAGLEAELDRLRASGEPVVLGQYLLRANLLRPDQWIELCELAERNGRACGNCGTVAEPSGHPDGVDLVCLGCGGFTDRSEPSPAAMADGKIGKYAIRRLIARGGMGVVYEAEDPELKRVVALKVVKDDGSSAATRLHREAAIAAQLRHPNIVGIYEVGLVREEKGGRTHFIAMEFVEGKTLASLLVDRSAQREELLRILEEVSRAVAYAHSRNVVHRDLKPANVLVNDSGRVVLTDFGLARAESLFQSRLTESRTVLGTPAYMAPEQALGKTKEIGPRTDVYALGAILYEVLAGAPPFAGSKPHDLERKILHRDPIPPSRLGRKVERELEVIAFKAMEKRPERRYPSALEFSEDLARFRRGEPILARPASTLYRVRKWFVRNRAVVVAAVCACAAIGAAAVFVPRLERTVRSPAPMDPRLLEQMRIAYHACLDAILALRRVGRVDEMAARAERAEQACRAVLDVDPNLAEPHYCLGRIYRALLRDDDALREQNLALERDPAYGPALYEHIVLVARKFRGRLEELTWEAERMAGETVEEEGIRGLSPRLSPQDLARDDSEAGRMRTTLERDLERIRQAEGQGISSGQYKCAVGIVTWVLGRTSEAREALEKAVAMDPTLEEAYEALATLEGEGGNWESAVEWWTKGWETDRGYVPHLEGRGMSHLWSADFAADVNGATEQYALAIADLSKALEIFPNRESARLRRGWCLLNRASFEKRHGENPAASQRAAARDFREAVNRDPASGQAWLWLGAALSNLAGNIDPLVQDPAREFREALGTLDSALERVPTLAEAWLFRGHANRNWGKAVRKRGGDPDRLYRIALEDYGKAIRGLPRRCDAWMARGETQFALGLERVRRREDPAEACRAALQDFDAAAELHPEGELHRVKARFNRAGCLIWWGDRELVSARDPSSYYQSAIEALDEILKALPKSVRALMDRAHAYANWGHSLSARGDPMPKFDSAIRDYGSVIELFPLCADAWIGRGGVLVNKAHVATGDRIRLYGESVQNLLEAVRLAPENPTAWEFLGNALMSLGAQRSERGESWREFLEAAICAYERALSLGATSRDELRQKIERNRRRLGETP